MLGFINFVIKLNIGGSLKFYLSGSFVSLFLAAGVAGQSLAQAPRPSYPNSGLALKTLVVETVYPFTLTKYTPAVSVPTVSKSTDLTTPEKAIIQHANALNAGDYEWLMSLWTPASQEVILESEKKSGNGKDYWVKAWRETGKRSFSLVSYVTYGRFVLVEYEFVVLKSGKKGRDSMALEKVGDNWFLTQALMADPFLQYWNTPSGRAQVPPASMFQSFSK